MNVGNTERLVSTAAGSILALLGLGRRDLVGLAIAGVGGALVARGVTGKCPVYKKMQLDTSEASESGVHVTVAYTINKSPEELYAFWRNFENLPKFMSHLESVVTVDARRSHWVAKAPPLYGGKVEWDAEVIRDEPNSLIEWRTTDNADVVHGGIVTFKKALGDRGTIVRTELNYEPPLGQVGRWIAKLFNEEPEQQIHDDLRKFRSLMEIGDILTVEGQPHGTCLK